jgi:hypothetical protein
MEQITSTDETRIQEVVMNFISEIEPCASARIVRAADGGINYEHYRIRARRERALAYGRIFAALGLLMGRADSKVARRRSLETPWLPAATPRRP